MISGYKAKVAAGVIAAIVVASALGVYLDLNLPSQAGPSGSGLLVYSNKVVVYDIPRDSTSISLGIWQLELGNGGSSALYATYQIIENGGFAYGGSTKLQPGQRTSIATCLLGYTPLASFDVPIFVTNSTGVIVPHYPVTIVYTTQVPFSGQFSTTSILRTNVYDPQLQRNVSTWNIAVTNSGKEQIQFLQAILWNGTEIIESPQLRCAGSVPYVSGLPANYSQPLSPGGTAKMGAYGSTLPSSWILGGRTYKMEIIAVYADYSEVVQSSDVQATP
jgi:hypothetical protein